MFNVLEGVGWVCCLMFAGAGGWGWGRVQGLVFDWGSGTLLLLSTRCPVVEGQPRSHVPKPHSTILNTPPPTLKTPSQTHLQAPPQDPLHRRHPGVVPPVHPPRLHEPGEFALGEDGVDEIEAGGVGGLGLGEEGLGEEGLGEEGLGEEGLGEEGWGLGLV